MFHVLNRGVGRRALFSAPMRGPRPALRRRAVGPPNGGTIGTGINAASTPPAEKGATEPMIPQRSAPVPLSSTCHGKFSADGVLRDAFLSV